MAKVDSSKPTKVQLGDGHKIGDTLINYQPTVDRTTNPPTDTDSQ